jgi:predicted RNA binding protein YcfA (HicA-like mRNA interferase family)
VSKHDKTKDRVLSGTSNANLRFDEICAMLVHMGFTERIKGSHHIYTKDGVPEIINIQPGGDGKAKPYQVKQIRQIINRLGTS